VDADLVRVAKNEVQELLAGCWQTLSSVPPVLEVKADPISVASSTSSDGQKLASLSAGTFLENQNQSQQEFRVIAKSATDAPSLSTVEGMGSGITLTRAWTELPGSQSFGAAAVPCQEPPPGPNREGDVDTERERTKEREKDREKEAPISGVVNQLFSGYRPSDICVDGMPVSVMRNLATRQMSMALQLLLQLLLLSDDSSECFNKCYTSIMELSNLRDSAVKKAKLMYLTLRNLAEYQSSMRAQKGPKNRTITP
jgi:hypothetical protein